VSDDLTVRDLPFIEQVADQMHPLAALLKKCGGHTDDSRHRWARAHVAARTADEDSIRAIMDAADTAVSEIPEDNDIMTALVRNPATPLDVLARLAWNPYFIVCELAAITPRLPEAELRRVAAAGPLGARVGAAKNPETPLDVLADLAADRDMMVRQCVAYSQRTPDCVIEALKADPDPWVREIARDLRGKDEKAYMAAVGLSVRRAIKESVAETLANATPEELAEFEAWKKGQR
jgi:hypothetical protein